MLNDLLSKLEKKTQVLVDTLELVQLERDELKDENKRLRQAQLELEDKLSSILDKLSFLDEEPGEETAVEQAVAEAVEDVVETPQPKEEQPSAPAAPSFSSQF